MPILSRGCVVVTLVALGGVAAADPYQVGGFFGPRFFSSDAALGTAANFRTSLDSTVVLGGRIARPLWPWIVPELELPLANVHTHDFGVAVLWLEPRAQIRLVWPHGKMRPFAVLGFGAPVVWSDKPNLYASGISWDGYGGIGAQFTPGHGLSFRADLRVAIERGYQAPVAIEVEGQLGLYVELEHRHVVRHAETVATAKAAGDRDGDGIPDDKDQCPDRPEDFDQFQDQDGCPDIDNDMDHVLDIADTCPLQPETYNGFEDEDGCPDTVPGDIDQIRGTVEGLVYAEGSTDVPSSARPALEKIAAAMKKFPSLKIILVGYTDDQEVKVQAEEGEEADATAQRQSDALVDLSKARAQAVAEALAALGVESVRVVVDGKGAADPVSDNDTPRHRLRNRRVELDVYVPPDEATTR